MPMSLSVLRIPIILILAIACTTGRPAEPVWSAADDFIGSVQHEVALSLAVHDIHGNELYMADSGKQVPSASVIKIPVLIELMRMVDTNELSLQETYVLAGDDIVGGAGDLQHAGAGGRYTLEYLAREMIRVSDNTASNVIIRRIGMERVNRLMAELGMKQSALNRYMMDFQAIEEGRQNYTSAGDMNRALIALMNENVLSESSRILALDMLEECADGELIKKYLPDSIQVAHKTGTLDYIRGDAGIIFAEEPFIMSIFAGDFDDLKTSEERMAELAKIIFDIIRRERAEEI
jgi:beta-lactamase class A